MHRGWYPRRYERIQLKLAMANPLSKASDVLSRQQPVRRDFVSEQQLSNQSASKRWRGVSLGGLNFLLDERIRAEILDDLTIHPVPTNQKIFHGLANLRGNLVAAYDFAAYLEEEIDNARWYLVLHTEPAWVCFSIDRLPVQIDLPVTSQLEQWPLLVDPVRNNVRAAYRQNDQMWLDVDLPALFSRMAAEVT